jgi:hypothetical protein
MHTFADCYRGIAGSAHPAYWLALLAALTLAVIAGMAAQAGAL